MSIIGKLTTSAASGTVEIAPALANFNFDFALFKIEAPKEFEGVGAALSTFRRREAENGMSHITARKLGALFEQLLPPVPELIKAYGQRASEISQSSSIDSRTRSTYGVFASRVGTDATSLWAAATSGQAAIAVHLLACMLAKMWEGSEATSIWVEIVKRRKEEVIAGFERDNFANMATFAAARQDLTRTQMAEWDASALAWLRAANAVKTKQQRQLMLILDNIQLPVNQTADTYSSVMKAWTTSLVQMEGLIKGVAQQAQGGDILLALSSWHLYPDIVVVVPSSAHVRQHDPIFASGGVLTIGLFNMKLQHPGIYWSLPLAHLRHYGAPVMSARSIDSNVQSRISLEELLQATLGCVLHGWGAAGSNTPRALAWLSQVSDILNDNALTDLVKARAMVHGDANASWFNLLLLASKYYLASTGNKRTVADKLISLGRKHGRAFLGLPPTPLLGLLEHGSLINLIPTEDGKIQFLRKVAEDYAAEMKLEHHQIFIRYSRHYPEWSKTVYEYVTALPWSRGAHKRKLDDSQQPGAGHLRWLYAGGDLRQLASSSTYYQRLDLKYGGQIEFSLSCEPAWPLVPADFAQWHNMRVQTQESFETERDLFTQDQCKQIHQEFETRRQFYSSKGEDVIRREDWLIEDFELHKMGIYFENNEMFNATLNTGDQVHSQWFKFLYGDVDSAAIFVLEGREHLVNSVRTVGKESDTFYSLFESGQFDANSFVNQLHARFHRANMEIDPYLKSLKALSTAAKVYKTFTNASVDIRVLQQRLYDAYWVRPLRRDIRSIKKHNDPHETPDSLRPFTLDRASAFACVTMFESGTYNVNPADLVNVMAMSSGDSIYVAAALLCDPSEDPPPGDIRRIAGNIGRPGIAFMVPPADPLMKEVSLSEWPQISRNDFDGQIKNCFQSTSLHLSFTGAQTSLSIGFSGAQDTDIYILETLISLHYGGKWFADLDVLKAINSLKLRRLPPCIERHGEEAQGLESQVTCIDNWLELVDAPEEHTSLVRAHKNWQARLAATAISIAKGYDTLVLPDKVCWRCFDLVIAKYWWQMHNQVIAIG
ncbi:MAG: hypothetical protein FRX48_09611 [Lasallia pustulata]|uniref:Uncharacterized protein n=1 Tax=Lasallia pustulata TaxID=136370 RepID=A0A5M8PC37_9LECA|nr:MAG: hypothetical protein FRX48_09611 [Lasallia pustulata]